MTRSIPWLLTVATLLVETSGPITAQDDSIRIDQPVPVSQPVESDTSDIFQMTKDPTTAVLWGLIPGGGQVYTEHYWKVPVFVLPIGALTALAIHFEGVRSTYAEEVRGLDRNSTEYNVAVANRNTNQDRRDLSIAVASGVFILSLIDAYSSAHLYDFDVGDSLASVRIYPDPVNNGVGVAVQW